MDFPSACSSRQVLQLYASEEILFRQNPVASAPTSGVGFGEKTEGESSSSGSTKAKTPANLLLEEILSTDEAKWDGILSGLSAPGRSMTGGVSKESLLGAIQVFTSSFCSGAKSVKVVHSALVYCCPFGS